MRRLILCLACLPTLSFAQVCGGPVSEFKAGLVAEAVTMGIAEDVAERYVSGLQLSDRVLAADRRQGVFQLNFIDFSRRLISNNRLQAARANRDRHASIFARVEETYGVPAEVLLAFWAFETDFGAVQGDYNTANALFTLAHDCRRPDLFRPQNFAAMELFGRGDF